MVQLGHLIFEGSYSFNKALLLLIRLEIELSVYRQLTLSRLMICCETLSLTSSVLIFQCEFRIAPLICLVAIFLARLDAMKCLHHVLINQWAQLPQVAFLLVLKGLNHA